jgi:uncharacterized protein YxeA
MLKKILFTFLALLITYSGAVIIYRLLEPETETSEPKTFIPYSSLKQYVAANGESSIHYLFFYSSADVNSSYVCTTVLSKTASQTGLDLSKIIETVDMTAIDQSGETSQLHTDWNISSYPAFAAVSVENGQTVVANTLEWDPEHPLEPSDIEEWLEENDLYQSTSAAKPVQSAD